MTYMQSNKSLKTTANIRRKDITILKYNIDNGKEDKEDLKLIHYKKERTRKGNNIRIQEWLL